MRRAVRWVDAESVRHYQVIVYLAYVVAGAQALLLGAPPNAVAQAMGHGVALAWIALIIACPVLSLAGLWLDRRGRPNGLWLQIAGDAGVAFASAAYVTSIVQATWAERATFAAWVVGALGVCAAAILVRDVRRVVLAGRFARELERE